MQETLGFKANENEAMPEAAFEIIFRFIFKQN